MNSGPCTCAASAYATELYPWCFLHDELLLYSALFLLTFPREGLTPQVHLGLKGLVVPSPSFRVSGASLRGRSLEGDVPSVSPSDLRLPCLIHFRTALVVLFP